MESREKSEFKRADIGLISKDWEVKKVGEFVTVKHGYAFKGEFFSGEPNENIVLTPGNFHIGGGFKADKLKYTVEDYLHEYVLKEGDIIVTMTDLSKNGDTLGYAAKVPHSQNGKYLHNQRIGLLQFKSKAVLPDFLYWALRTKRYNAFVVGSASGSTVKHTSPDRICQFSFGVPPLMEQQNIAEFLSNLESRIELNQQMNKTLEAIGQAVFKRWFVDFEFPNEEGKPYKSSGGEMVDAGDIGEEIPKGWKVGCIEDVADVVGGGTPSTSVETYFTNAGIPWLTPKDLSGFEGKFIDKGATDVTEEGLRNSSAKLMPKGTILFTSRAPVGYVAIALNSITTNQGFKSLVPKNKMQTEYLYQYLKMKTPYIQSISCGSTFGEISGRAMKGIEIIVPEELIVKKFEGFIAPVNSRIVNNMFGVRTLKEIRDSLLPRLMSGTIRIPFRERTADNTK